MDTTLRRLVFDESTYWKKFPKNACRLREKIFSWSRWIDKPQNILSSPWCELFYESSFVCGWGILKDYMQPCWNHLLTNKQRDTIFLYKKSAWKANGQASRLVYVRLFMLNSIKERFRSSSHWDLSVRRSINDNYWSTISHTDRPPNNLSPRYAMINGRLNEISLVIFHYSP